MKRLSDTMRQTIRAILAQGNRATPEGGGWWKGDLGDRLFTDKEAGKDVSTGTIYALESRGFLRRVYLRPERWRDSYEVTEHVLIVADPWAAGKKALKEALR